MVRFHRFRPCALPCCPHPVPRHDEESRVTNEVEQIIEPAARIATAQRCSFRCILRTRSHATSGSGHGAPVFTSGLHSMIGDCEHAGPLRHVTGFPDLGLLRILRPPHGGIGRRRAFPPDHWMRPGKGATARVPTYTVGSIDGSGAQLCSRDIAAALRRSLRTEGTNPIPEFPAHNVIRVRAAAQPRSTSFELVGTDLRSSQTLVSHVHRPVLLAGPTSSGSADASRRCRGCLLPSPASPGSGCPQLQPAAATAGR